MNISKFLQVTAIIAFALFLPNMAAAMTVLFQEDFENIAAETNLVGQNGWAALDPLAPGPLFIRQGVGLSSKVADGHVDPGTDNEAALFHNFAAPLSLSGASILSIDAYAFSAGPPSHNFSVSLSSPGLNRQLGWSYFNPGDSSCSGGWVLNSSGGQPEFCTTDSRVVDNRLSLEVILDADSLEYYGRIFDANGLVFETPKVSILLSDIVNVSHVIIRADYRDNVRLNGEFDNVLLVTGIPEPAAILAFLSGLAAFGFVRRQIRN